MRMIAADLPSSLGTSHRELSLRFNSSAAVLRMGPSARQCPVCSKPCPEACPPRSPWPVPAPVEHHGLHMPRWNSSIDTISNGTAGRKSGLRRSEPEQHRCQRPSYKASPAGPEYGGRYLAYPRWTSPRRKAKRPYVPSPHGRREGLAEERSYIQVGRRIPLRDGSRTLGGHAIMAGVEDGLSSYLVRPKHSTGHRAALQIMCVFLNQQLYFSKSEF